MSQSTTDLDLNVYMMILVACYFRQVVHVVVKDLPRFEFA